MWVLICEICGGTGKEQVWYYNRNTGEGYWYEDTCERCGGDGCKKESGD